MRHSRMSSLFAPLRRRSLCEAGIAERVLDELVVQIRHAGLQRAQHRHAVDLDQQIVRQPPLHVAKQQLVQ
jgi:hypothetical protein